MMRSVIVSMVRIGRSIVKLCVIGLFLVFIKGVFVVCVVILRVIIG